MRWMILLVAALSSACADLGPLGTVHPTPPGGAVTDKNIPPDTSDGSSTAPGDPEPRWPVRIIDTRADVYMPDFYAGDSYPGDMRLVGGMLYDAYHAEMGVSLAISGPDAISRTFTPEQRHSNTFFNNSLGKTWSHYIRSACGNAIYADFSYRAWWNGPGGWIMDSQLRGRSVNAAQGNCPTSGGGSGPGDSTGGGTIRCYTLVTHHYEYDPETGESRYLYTTEEDLGCEYIS